MCAAEGVFPRGGRGRRRGWREGKVIVSALRFFREFIAAPVNVGAFAASSVNLAEKTVEAAEIGDSSVVVEYGPGTGVITQSILNRLPGGAKFLTIEIQEDFVKAMKERFPDVNVIHGSAEDTRKHLRDIGEEHCDRIVSGLPWAGFSEDLQDRLLDAVCDSLRPGGRFCTYTYLLSPYLPGGRRFRKKLNERFSKTGETSMVWANLPPAFVYWAEK